MEKFCEGFGSANGGGIRGSGTADPEKELKRVAVPGEGDAESIHPLFSFRGSLAPGGTSSGDLLKGDCCGTGELTFGNEVAAGVNDEINMADENGTSFDTGIAGGAGPEGFFGDGGRDVFASADGPVSVLDNLFRVENFARVVSGADFGTSSTGHAGIEAEEVPS